MNDIVLWVPRRWWLAGVAGSGQVGIFMRSGSPPQQHHVTSGNASRSGPSRSATSVLACLSLLEGASCHKFDNKRSKSIYLIIINFLPISRYRMPQCSIVGEPGLGPSTDVCRSNVYSIDSPSVNLSPSCFTFMHLHALLDIVWH